MGIFVEVLLEAILWLVGEVVLETGSRGLARLLASRIGRGVIALAAIALAYGGGWWWAHRFAGAGQTAWPTALRVTVGLALVFALLALLRRLRTQAAPKSSPPAPASSGDGLRAGLALAPWRWPAGRLAGFALLNAAAAMGILVGFSPAGQ